jgi:hypothetical protein
MLWLEMSRVFAFSIVQYALTDELLQYLLSEFVRFTAMIGSGL